MINSLECYLDDYLDENEADENEKQIILNQLNEFLDADFPIGLNNLPNEVTLYRLLAVYNKDEINTEKLGRHFVADKNLLSDPDFHDTIGIAGSFKSFYVVTIKTNSENIDNDETLKNRVRYPCEKEFTLKGNDLNIINIEKITNINEEETITVYYPTTEERATIILRTGWWNHYDPQRVCSNLACAKKHSSVILKISNTPKSILGEYYNGHYQFDINYNKKFKRLTKEHFTRVT